MKIMLLAHFLIPLSLLACALQSVTVQNTPALILANLLDRVYSGIFAGPCLRFHGYSCSSRPADRSHCSA